jgi:hypothetical protein
VLEQVVELEAPGARSVDLLSVTAAQCDSQVMTPMAIAVLLVAAAALVALASLTAIGERRRGGRLAVAVITGVFFPLAWIAWYARDELRTSYFSS